MILELDPNVKTHVIGERTFNIENKLSVDRYIRYSELVPEIAYGLSFAELSKRFNEIHKLSTTGNDVIKALHKIAEISYNTSSSIVTLHERKYPPLLLFATLVFVEDCEDVKTWSISVAEEKINYWRSKGVAMSFFFQLWAISTPRFIEEYQELTKKQQ